MQSLQRVCCMTLQRVCCITLQRVCCITLELWWCNCCSGDGLSVHAGSARVDQLRCFGANTAFIESLGKVQRT